ncbi:MltR family transcriptional regulator [uncultured Flavobacterium sp.]|uniref:MltR family transcriptional regulator n=1 Tax=uncultured Flavobacterium sp. TaxID=165435 RepID=UPI00292D25E7|nr:MltR family transcriptional regulator [uncultured Flavobacterium sp.]
MKEHREEIEKVLTFRSTLNKETDRGCALMAASFLESELADLLRKKLVGTKSQLDNLFEFNGPLGTFSSKIKICYSLGFINKATMDDLDLIRKIRNEFGHDYNPIDFSTEAIKNRIGNLKSNFFNSGEVSPRFTFTNTVVGILGTLTGSKKLIKQFEESAIKEPSEELKKATKEMAFKYADEMIQKIKSDSKKN